MSVLGRLLAGFQEGKSIEEIEADAFGVADTLDIQEEDQPGDRWGDEAERER